MNRAIAVFKKQQKDTLKNKTILLQFVLFPVIAFFFTEFVAKTSPGIPNAYFVTLFSSMYAGMVPLVTMANIIAEETQAKSLRILIMSNVKPYEYLLGVGGHIVLLCTVGTVALGLIGGFTGGELIRFIVSMLMGIIASLLLGSAIGIYAKNQGAATAMATPISMITAFVPMVGLFNDSFAAVAKILYTQQISNLLNDLSASNFEPGRFLIIGANIIVFAMIFIFVYMKKGLREA